MYGKIQESGLPDVIPLLCTFASMMAQLVKNLQCRRPAFDPWVGKIPWRRERLPTPVFWPGELRGMYSPRGHKELDTTERLCAAQNSYYLLLNKTEAKLYYFSLYYGLIFSSSSSSNTQLYFPY